VNRYRVLLLDLKKRETEKVTGWVYWSRAVDAFHGFCDSSKVPRAAAEDALLSLMKRDVELATVSMPDGNLLLVVRAP
jgi:hypothetical protein